jgi:N-acetylmuramoyl-L-alanine amidase
MRTIKKIIVHTSDSPDTRADVDAAEIRRWHTAKPPKGNGWADIGYHYVVKRDGTVEPGRPEEKIGAHCKNQNFDSIGVVWVGRNKQTPEQAKSLRAIVQALMVKYKLEAKNVFGHYEFEPGKTCPNLDMEAFRASLAPLSK